MSINRTFDFYENFEETFLKLLEFVDRKREAEEIRNHLRQLMNQINKIYRSLKFLLAEYNRGLSKENQVKVEEMKTVLNSFNPEHPHHPFTLEGLKTIFGLIREDNDEFATLELTYYNQMEEIVIFCSETVKNSQLTMEDDGFLVDEKNNMAYYIGIYEDPYDDSELYEDLSEFEKMADQEN